MMLGLCIYQGYFTFCSLKWDILSLQNVSEVSTQITPQIIYYSLSNLPLFGCYAVFVCVNLNANELLLSASFPEEGWSLYSLCFGFSGNNISFINKLPVLSAGSLWRLSLYTHGGLCVALC